MVSQECGTGSNRWGVGKSKGGDGGVTSVQHASSLDGPIGLANTVMTGVCCARQDLTFSQIVPTRDRTSQYVMTGVCCARQDFTFSQTVPTRDRANQYIIRIFVYIVVCMYVCIVLANILFVYTAMTGVCCALQDFTFGQIVPTREYAGLRLSMPPFLNSLTMEWAGQDSWRRWSSALSILDVRGGNYMLRKIINRDGSNAYWFDKGWLAYKGGVPVAVASPA